ncbi:MAG: GntR family transcriptional regulator [Bacteroidales bacterium]|nr:GntR family transcriptional regulator [Candidatus Cryptobacteroides choladohippi]
MEFDSNRPIYLQIADGICEQILQGKFKPGERIPSVREWAANIGVNPNTVARSYETLSDRGIIFNTRGIGFSVASDALDAILEEERRKFTEEELPAILRKAELLGLNLKELF